MDTTLLEREVELARLAAAANEALSGTGRMVLLIGEAGVGKTTLVRHLQARLATEMRTWIGSCEQLFTARPLGPVADIAAIAGGRLSEIVARGGAVHAVFPILLHELRAAPTLVVIEDVHWADEATLDVVVLLARRIATTHSLVVVTCREELGRDHPLRLVMAALAGAGAERLRVSPLTIDAVRTLAAQVAHEVDADELYSRTKGNPFFVTEVLAAGETELPPSVRDAVLARAAALPADSRRLLDSLSILTAAVPLALIEPLAAHDAAGLAACLASGIVVESQSAVAFRHDLARTAIAEAIDPLRRTVLHRIALGVLRGVGADAATLAHHADGAGDTGALASLAPLAAAEAVARGAHREAAAQYRRALTVTESAPGPLRVTLLELGAHEMYLTDHFDEAIEWLEQAVVMRRTAVDVLGEANALRRLSAVQRCGARREQAYANGRRAVELLQRLPPGGELAAALSNLAMLALNSNDIESGLVASERALNLAQRCGDGDVHVHALNTHGMLRMLDGDDGGLSELGESLQISLLDGRAEHAGRAYIHLADMAQRHRLYDVIDEHFADAFEFCSEHGLDLWMRYLQTYHARTELDRGRWSSAVAAIPVGTESAGTPLASIGGLVVLGLVRARRGDPGSWPALEEARRRSRGSGELQWVAPATAAMVEAAWLTGRQLDDVEESGDVLDQCVQLRAGWWAGEIAWWRRCNGIDEPPPAFVSGPWATQLGGDPEGAAHAWRRLGCPYEEALALFATGERAAAATAVDILQSLGAAAAVTAMSRAMRSEGRRDIPRGVRPSTRANPAGLTAREVEVLQLVSGGLRNAEIAARLVVSAKTVDHHVSAILRKLDVTTRGAAAREAVRLGIQDGEPPGAT